MKNRKKQTGGRKEEEKAERTESTKIKILNRKQ